MELGIENKVALVTASSKGLGFYSAVALGLEGVKLVINSSDAGHLADAASILKGMGIEVTAIQSDLKDPKVPGKLIENTVEKYGSVDIVVANAPGPKISHSLDLSDEDIVEAVNNNMLTTVRLFRSAADIMKKQNWGRLISISSFSIMEAIPNLALSNLSRKSLFAWIKTAAFDLGKERYNVTINSVCPGVHLTDRIKQLHEDTTELRTGDPEDFGKIVAFLASKQAGNINGAAIVVDGGATLNI
jgi:3-oxoacyl-[acyl-carrier protein] reductase